MGVECPKCKTENTSDSQFCKKCATSLPPSEDINVSRTKTIQKTKEKSALEKSFAGKYQIREELGRGGMGIVYKAEDTKLKRTVALKFLPPELARDKEARERFIREAQAAAALDHPNICTVYEADEAEGKAFISMAYIEGESLRKIITKGPIKYDKAMEIAIQVAEGLEEAHKKGIVHRDIKSANIMVTEKGQAKIMDFGLAKVAGSSLITKEATTMGTVAYMSPEQARGEELDERTDIWSLGVILYEMISGNLPFRGANDQSIVFSILNEDPVPVKELEKGIPIELEKIIRRALSKDMAKRFSSAREMVVALQDLKAKLIEGETLTTIQLIFRKPRKRLLIGGIIGIVVVAVIFLTWIFTRPTLAFNIQDKLLVADVDNQTGDSVFDMALRTAIEADLQQSPYASVFDKAQVAETLRLMRMDPSSRIDENLGYDICRFSGIRAMILPRILAAGEAFELQAILIDPRRKRHVDRIRVSALGREEVLLNAIDKLARQVRSRLGESLKSIEEADKPVVQLSTSSWEALNYLSMGQAKWHEGKFKESVAFFELALEKDPKFVSARGSLGLVLIQFLNQKEKGKEMLRMALKDAEGIPQLEYLLIKAVNLWYVDEDYEGALETYRITRELYPDTMVAYNNAGAILRDIGRLDEAVAMFEKAAEVAPRNSTPLANLWWTHITFRRDPVSAEQAGRHVVALGPEIAIYHHWLGYALAAQARFDEAIEAYKMVLSLEPQHPYGLPNMAYILLASGRAAEAVPYFKEVRELVQQERIQGYYPTSCFDLALALRESGDTEAARKIAEEGIKNLIDKVGEIWEAAWVPLLMAKLEIAKGKDDKVDEYVNQAKSLGLNDQGAFIYLAEVFALSGKHEEAIDTLKQVLESGYSDPYFLYIYPAFLPIRNDPRFRALFDIKMDQ